MAIAEMQCERGLIDKAIEMNTAAVNFCKNNRVCCFNEALHLQKHKLIDAKLRERIEAIEKGIVFHAAVINNPRNKTEALWWQKLRCSRCVFCNTNTSAF